MSNGNHDLKFGRSPHYTQNSFQGIENKNPGFQEYLASLSCSRHNQEFEGLSLEFGLVSRSARGIQVG